MTALRAVFVDTGAWVALRYGRDRYHQTAKRLVERLHRERVGLVTTEWVLGEAVTLLKARGAVSAALALGESLLGGRLGYLVDSTGERRARAWDLFVRYKDRRVGWVDCASFAVMEELGLRRFFGFDDDFVRAGFVAYR